MLTAAFLVRWWKQSEWAGQPSQWKLPGWVWRMSVACLTVIGIILLIALPLVAGWITISPLYGRTLPDVAWLIPLALLPIGAGWMTWKRWSKNQIGWGIAIVLVSSIALTANLAAWGPLAADQERGSRPLAQLLFATVGNTDARVGIHPSYYRPSMIFYLKREVIRCVSQEQVKEVLQAPVKTFMLVPEKALGELMSQLSGQITVLDKRHDFTAGQEIFLISNLPGSGVVPVNTSPASGTTPGAEH